MVPPLEFSYIRDSYAESKRMTNTDNQKKQYSLYIKLKSSETKQIARKNKTINRL